MCSWWESQRREPSGQLRELSVGNHGTLYYHSYYDWLGDYHITKEEPMRDILEIPHSCLERKAISIGWAARIKALC